MGQYYNIANEDKKEYIVPPLLKMWEIMNNPISGALTYLTADAPYDGGGTPTANYSKFKDENGDLDWDQYDEACETTWPNFGRWAGDRIVTVGDYAESGLYDELEEEEWTEISQEVLPEVRAAKADTMGREGVRMGEFGSYRDSRKYVVFQDEDQPDKFYGVIEPDSPGTYKTGLHDTPLYAEKAARSLAKEAIPA